MSLGKRVTLISVEKPLFVEVRFPLFLSRNAVLHSAYSETFLLPHLKDIPAQHSTVSVLPGLQDVVSVLNVAV